MRLTVQFAALAVASLVSRGLCLPLSGDSQTSEPVPMSSAESSYSSGSSAGLAIPDSSLAAASPTLWQPNPNPTYTVVTETFTISIGSVTTVCPGSASVPTAAASLSAVVATFTVPVGSSSTTLLHTFTYTPGPSVSPRVTPSPSTISSAPIPSQPLASLSLDPLLQSSQSVASVESELRSILSWINTATDAGVSAGAGPRAVRAHPVPESLITASFTLTIPPATAVPTTEPDFGSTLSVYTGSMSTAKFTITLPGTPSPVAGSLSESSKTAAASTSWLPSCESKTEKTTKTVTTCLSSVPSASSSPTCDESLTATGSGSRETLTLTRTTKVTLTVDNGPTSTTTCTETRSPAQATRSVPTGPDAITLTYTLPGGLGRPSQVVTITTVRPTPLTNAPSAGTASGPSVSYPSWPTGSAPGSAPSASGSAPSASGFPRSSIPWSFTSWSSSSVPTAISGTGSSFSLSSTATQSGLPDSPVSPSISLIQGTHTPAVSHITVVTTTATFTSVHTATIAGSPKSGTELLLSQTASPLPPSLAPASVPSRTPSVSFSFPNATSVNSAFPSTIYSAGPTATGLSRHVHQRRAAECDRKAAFELKFDQPSAHDHSVIANGPGMPGKPPRFWRRKTNPTV